MNNQKYHSQYAKVVFALSFASILAIYYTTVLQGSELVIAATIAALVFVFEMRWFGSKLDVFMEKHQHGQFNHAALADGLLKSLGNKPWQRLLNRELHVLFYAFFARQLQPMQVNIKASFSYEKASNCKDVYWVVAIAQLPTLPFIHFVMDKEGAPLAAWLVTSITLWSVLCYWSQIYAVRFNPIEVNNGLLRYRFGLAWHADIPLHNIKSARKLTPADRPDHFAFFMSPFGSNKNVLLEFHQPVKFVGRYSWCGKKSKAAISIDNPEAFLAALGNTR